MAAAGGHHRGARGDNRANFLSGLLETDAIVLHCDERQAPPSQLEHGDMRVFKNRRSQQLLIFVPEAVHVRRRRGDLRQLRLELFVQDDVFHVAGPHSSKIVHGNHVAELQP